jgi:hypothetical protein
MRAPQSRSRRHYVQDDSFQSNNSSPKNASSSSIPRSLSDLSTVIARHDQSSSLLGQSLLGSSVEQRSLIESSSMPEREGSPPGLMLPSRGHQMGSLLDFSDENINSKSESHQLRARMKERHTHQKERYQTTSESIDQHSFSRLDSTSPPRPGMGETDELSLDDLLRISPIGTRDISETSSPFSSPHRAVDALETSRTLSLAEIIQEIENISTPPRSMSGRDFFDMSLHQSLHPLPPPQSSSRRPLSPLVTSSPPSPPPSPPSSQWIFETNHQSPNGSLRMNEVPSSHRTSQNSPSFGFGSEETDSLTFLRESNTSAHHALSISSHSHFSQLHTVPVSGSREQAENISFEASLLSTHSLPSTSWNDQRVQSITASGDRGFASQSSQSTSSSSFLFLGVGENFLDEQQLVEQATFQRDLGNPSEGERRIPFGESHLDSSESTVISLIDPYSHQQQPHTLSFEEKYGLRVLPAEGSSDEEEFSQRSNRQGRPLTIEASPSSTSSSLSIPSFKIVPSFATLEGPEPEGNRSFVPSKSVLSPRQQLQQRSDEITTSRNPPLPISQSLLSFNSNLSSDLFQSHSSALSVSQSNEFLSRPRLPLPPSTVSSSVHHTGLLMNHQETSRRDIFSVRDSTEEFESWLEGITNGTPAAAQPPSSGQSFQAASFSLSFTKQNSPPNQSHDQQGSRAIFNFSSSSSSDPLRISSRSPDASQLPTPSSGNANQSREDYLSFLHSSISSSSLSLSPPPRPLKQNHSDGEGLSSITSTNSSRGSIAAPVAVDPEADGLSMAFLLGR